MHGAVNIKKERCNYPMCLAQGQLSRHYPRYS